MVPFLPAFALSLFSRFRAKRLSRFRASFRSRWAILFAAALLIALALGWLRWAPPRRAAPEAADPALWALPESEAERRALAQAGEPHGAERLGAYYLAAGRPFAAVWQFQEALADEAAGTAEARLAATSRLAEALQRGRWYEPAARLLAPIAVAASGNQAARQQLAGLYLATGRPDQAVRKRLPNDLQVAVTIMYVFGWRLGEVMNLRLSQVDLEAGTLRLEPGTTKNKEGRVVYLTPELELLLAVP